MSRRSQVARTVFFFATAMLLPCCMGTGAPMVRVGYVIPQNRSAQPGAVDTLRDLILNVQDWYSEQMERYGFGYKTFAIEMESDGITPKIHVVSTNVSDATIRTDTWGQTINAATAAGLPIWSSGQVWLLVPESHLQQPNGSIIGGTALGASFGSGSDPGVAMMGSDILFRASAATLQNTQAYHGANVPEIGPYPLVQDVSFPWFEGNTLSSIASSIQGATAHELGHAFGLGHDYRNDNNFDGIVMGHGLRGWRGARFPDQFPDDDTQLGQAAALVLNESQYFNASQTVTDSVKPNISIQTSGSVNPISGHLNISFTASDTQALAAALLHRNGDVIGQLVLSGTSISSQFITPFYTPGQNDNYTIAVFDSQGNRRDASASIIVNTGFNRAPQAFIDLSRSTATVGQSVLLDASQSSDPGGNSATMLVEWDLNGDGVFDTTPTTTKLFSTTYSLPGDYKVFARLTDTAGAISVSSPLVLHVVPLAGDFNVDGTVDAADYVMWRKSGGTPTEYNTWRTNFGESVGGAGGSGLGATGSASAASPEPGAVTLAMVGIVGIVVAGGRGVRRI